MECLKRNNIVILEKKVFGLSSLMPEQNVATGLGVIVALISLQGILILIILKIKILFKWAKCIPFPLYLPKVRMIHQSAIGIHLWCLHLPFRVLREYQLVSLCCLQIGI